MVTFLAPGFLDLGIVAAAGVVAIHLVGTRRPRAVPFPTARFIPERPAPAHARALTLRDLLLLLLRAVALFLLGAALAGPVLAPRRARVLRIVVADVSADADPRTVRDAVARLVRSGDALIAFDTAARRLATGETLPPSVIGAGPGSLSAGLAAALRTAPLLRDRADSLALLVVSPARSAEIDSATAALIARWPARIGGVRIAGASAAVRASAPARVVWGDSTRPPRAVPRRPIDTVMAIAVPGATVLVAPLVRRWIFPPDSLRGARVIARWPDGVPAALEVDGSAAAACTRSIAFAAEPAGDVPLRSSFRAIVARLREPCETAADSSVEPHVAALLDGPATAAPTSAFPPPPASRAPMAPWLAGCALLLLLLEPLARHRGLATTAAAAGSR